MPGVPVFVPAPVVDDRGYSPFARRSSASSLPRRPVSASAAYKQQLPQRPSSAKPLRRPTSAKSTSAPTCQSVDYLGISNMIKSMNFKTSRKWREKSPDADVKGKGRGHSQSPPPRRVVAWKDKNEDEQKETEKEKEKPKNPKTQKYQIKNSRHNRSSNFTKFKYPQQYHYGSSASHVNFLERNIPQCLRRGPRYANQPVRQNCNFNPVNSVTHLKWHSIRSNSLPGYKGPAIPIYKAPSEVASEPDEESKPEPEGGDEWSNGPHTGSFEYVYQGKSKRDSQVLFDEDLEEEDEMYADELNNNQTPREAVISVLNSEGESDAESVAEEDPQSSFNQRSIPAPEIAEDVEDEIPERMDEDNPKTGQFKSSVSRESENATGYLDYQDYVDEVPEEVKDSHSVADSVKSSKSSRSVKSSSSKSRSRKSSRSSTNSLKYADADINEILGSDDDDDIIDQYMNTLKTPRDGGASRTDGRMSRLEEERDGGASRMDGRMSRLEEEQNGRFSRLGGEEVTRDSKFRKSVRIHESPNFSDDEIPEDKDDTGSVDSYDMSNLPPLSMLGSSTGNPEPKRRVVRPMTAVRRNLEEDDGF